MVDVSHHAWLIFEIETPKFLPRVTLNHDPSVSTFQINGVTGVRHPAWPKKAFYNISI
jgi:hypothetical protein